MIKDIKGNRYLVFEIFRRNEAIVTKYEFRSNVIRYLKPNYSLEDVLAICLGGNSYTDTCGNTYRARVLNVSVSYVEKLQNRVRKFYEVNLKDYGVTKTNFCRRMGVTFNRMNTLCTKPISEFTLEEFTKLEMIDIRISAYSSNVK